MQGAIALRIKHSEADAAKQVARSVKIKLNLVKIPFHKLFALVLGKGFDESALSIN